MTFAPTSSNGLGFGGSGLMTRGGRRASLALLESAFDAGVRHFDVAPSYGFGEAEECLGHFVRRHRGDITVTTKYGIDGRQSPTYVKAVRHAARFVLARSPWLRTLRESRASSPGPPVPPMPRVLPPLSVEAARISLDRSLRFLGGHVDVWLFHEATLERFRDHDLLVFAEDAVSRGDIGTYGVGSAREPLNRLWSAAPEYCNVVQTEWSVLDNTVSYPGAFQIFHRALGQAFRIVSSNLNASAERTQSYSAEIGFDVARTSEVAAAMVRAARLNNPLGITLFSSSDVRRIQQNVQSAQDRTLDDHARALQRVVMRDAVHWLTEISTLGG